MPTTTPISGEGVFGLSFMASFAYVTLPIPRLVCLEVVEALRPALRQRSNVTVMRVIAVVDVAEKAMMAVKPGAGSNEQPADKPVGPIVAIRSTVIRRIVEVPVRAYGSRPNIYANRNLGARRRRTAEKGNCKSCENKRIDFEHDFSLVGSELQSDQ
jgi:hypothetical protein